MARELIGEIGVDSGSLIIIDPGYLNEPSRWNPKRLLELAKEHEKKGEDWEAQNTHRLAKEKQELQNMILDWTKYCDESTHEPRKYAGGVITPTRYGDGGYPVYIHRNKAGEVTKLEVLL